MTRSVAVFDLDGTLTVRDTSLDFLRHLAGPDRVRRGLSRGVVWALPDLVSTMALEWGGDRNERLGGVRGRWEARFHERVAVGCLRGRSRDEIESQGEGFAQRVEETLLRSDARPRIEAHLAQGDRLILASASLDSYVVPLAERLGFDGALGTRVEYHDDRATGRFEGRVCWGLEKLRRVRDTLAPDDLLSVAYGDSPGDTPLLEAAETGIWIR